LDNNKYLQVQKLKYDVLKDSGLTSDADKTLDDIKKMDPSFNESGRIKSVILIPDKIRPYLEKAEMLRKNGKLSEALSVLRKANTIREIPYTNLCIGKLLFSQNKVEALPYLEKAHIEIKDDPSLVYCLSALYIMKQDVPRAKKAIDDYGRLEGENHPNYKKLKELFNKHLKSK
jgi:tetratricopeptide (TPR) repeat protein